MRIALCGTHRSGKTAVANHLSERISVPYIPANVSQCSIWSTFKPSDNMTFAERYYVQEILLSEYTQYIQRIEYNSYVLDRSPMDFLMYLLCNIDSTTSILFDRKVEQYINRCIQLCSDFFDVFIVIQPGINFVVEEGKNNKVYNSQVYQEALTNCIIGCFYRYLPKMIGEKQFIVIPDDIISINDRVAFIKTCIK